jgi:hypothetical protein
VAGLGLVLVAVQSATAVLFVGLPLLVCAGAGAVAFRHSRRQ